MKGLYNQQTERLGCLSDEEAHQWDLARAV